MKRTTFLSIILLMTSVCSRAELGARGGIGLVLSGGGAKGLSHIGVIMALEENEIPIDYICGTSMGAVIASMYAIGFSPSEMLDLVGSKEFESWCSGEQEADFANYFYREEPLPKMLNLSFARENVQGAEVAELGKLRISLPTSLVTPYPLDLAMMEFYASPSMACGYDFSQLMVPFFCISADILNKRKIVHTTGDLGSAVRASMTYPFVFKPIIIDSVVLFDGGFYDNFPWKELNKLYTPSFIIGARCVSTSTPLDDENIVAQVTNMISSATDYSIPPQMGLVIEGEYPYGVMEFDKLEEIVALGYNNAMKYIPQIKELVHRRRPPRDLDSMRLCFRQKIRPLKFGKEIFFEGKLGKRQQDFIRRAIAGTPAEEFSFNTLKKGYYNVAATGTVKTFYPFYELGQDSVTTLKIRGSAAAPLKIFVGGNISSADLNQGYAGVSYTKLGRSPWSLLADVNIGTFYVGGGVRWRHNFGLYPLAYYDLEMVAHRFRYNYPVKKEYREEYLRGGIATIVDAGKNLMLKGNFYLGSFAATSLLLYKNTLDNPQYATQGTELRVGGAWRSNGIFRARGRIESYFGAGRYLKLGWCADIALQNRREGSEYIDALLQMPVFGPFPHSRTLLLQRYRANSYIGVGISPVICATKTLFLHCNISFFQPYREILVTGDGGYRYGEKFPNGSFLGNAALVWQSPAGPVSFSVSYYQRGERYKWYPQFNLGFLLFKNRIMED